VPNCRAYDPAYAYEVAVILEHGMQRMLDEQHDEFYYLTVTNENLPQPTLPAEDARTGILRGMHRVRAAHGTAQVRLLGAGPMLDEALRAADLLQEHGVAAEVWSVTSFSELSRDGRACERARTLGLDTPPAWVEQCLPGDAPVVAASDYVRAVPEQIRAWIAAPYRTVGTDGFGRSDTRARLRDFFEVGADWIALQALDLLAPHSPSLAAARQALREKLGALHRQTPPWLS